MGVGLHVLGSCKELGVVLGEVEGLQGNGGGWPGAMGRVKGVEQGGGVCKGLGGMELCLLSFPLQGPRGWGCTGAATGAWAQPSESHRPIPA